MNINVNQTIAYLLYIIVIGVGGYVTKVWKANSSKLLELKAREEERAEKLLGQQNYNAAKQIVVDSVYKVEQLAKEAVEEQWSGLDKHSKAIQFVSSELNKAGLTLSDENIYSIIKTTVRYINAGKAVAPASISTVVQK